MFTPGQLLVFGPAADGSYRAYTDITATNFIQHKFVGLNNCIVEFVDYMKLDPTMKPQPFCWFISQKVFGFCYDKLLKPL